MAFSKAIRQSVYAKYNGRCAYCGREIAYKDMQIDHFVAKRGWNESGSDDISNLMPSCRMCNHYKRANSLETFRHYIQEIPRKLRENYIYKVGVVYGNVIECEKPIIFFFEKERNKATPQTRADKIRAMSDEEITEFVCRNGINTLCDIICGGECNAIASFKKSGDEACKEIVMKWLQQPAEEGER